MIFKILSCLLKLVLFQKKLLKNAKEPKIFFYKITPKLLQNVKKIYNSEKKKNLLQISVLKYFEKT